MSLILDIAEQSYVHEGYYKSCYIFDYNTNDSSTLFMFHDPIGHSLKDWEKLAIGRDVEIEGDLYSITSLRGSIYLRSGELCKGYIRVTIPYDRCKKAFEELYEHMKAGKNQGYKATTIGNYTFPDIS